MTEAFIWKTIRCKNIVRSTLLSHSRQVHLKFDLNDCQLSCPRNAFFNKKHYDVFLGGAGGGRRDPPPPPPPPLIFRSWSGTFSYNIFGNSFGGLDR